MNFVVFPVGATNIFPLANSSTGSQLLSEFNIRSRESVETDPSVKYFIGPSFTHSMDDFKVFCQRDGQDITISNTAIQIQPGRALVNGHYVESLTSVVVDLDNANMLAQQESITPLKGKLAVGLRMAYSTYQTLAGSALVEDDQGYFEGIQVVVLPADLVKLPKDVPGETEFSKVNMHLLLATFTYRNGVVSNVVQNENKIKSISADRISNMEDIFSDVFVSKTNLDPNKLYVFSGKSADGQSIDGRDTWCDATDSLMEWDSHPVINRTVPGTQAAFRYDPTSKRTILNIPHKQVDGMVNTQGQRVYFQDKKLLLPEATFDGSGGVVGPAYTARIKEIEEKINTYYRLPNGRMRQYIPVLNNREDLPEIPVSEDIRWPYAVSDYEIDIADLEANLDALAEEVSNLKITLEAQLKSDVNDAVNSAMNTSSTVVLIQNNLDQLSSQISDLQSQINQLRDDINLQPSTTDPTIPDPEHPTQNATEQYVHDQLAEYNNKVTMRLSSIARGMSGLENTLSTIRTDIAGIATDVTNIEGHLPEQIAAEVAEQLNALTVSIQEAIDDFTSDIADLRNDLITYIDSVLRTELDDRSVLAKWTWRPGDYVLVGEDRTTNATVSGRYPSTMYVVGPPKITSIRFLGTAASKIIETSFSIDAPNYVELEASVLRMVPTELAGGVEIDSYQLNSLDELTSSGFWDLANGNYKGAPGIDYFVARYKTIDDSTHIETWKCYFYTPNMVNTKYSYIDEPIWITGGVPLATESAVGGFVNVPEDAYGGGYVRMDENGYLKVMDYELLLTGVLSYQLGQDRSEGSGLSLEELQGVLNDDVNERVCFPNAAQIVAATESAVDPHIIHLYLTLPEEAGQLVIHDIGSRYGSSLYVHIRGSATSATTISFENCDKLRIDEDIEGAPQIILQNVNLFYNATVLDACTYIDNLSLWYQRWSDLEPDLQVDGMTVALTGPIETTEDIDPWDSTYANDNHYSYSLRSITLGNDGSIINVGMLVGDSTTANIEEGKSVFVSEFVLPQSVGINYPVTKMTHRVKVSGSFVSHYYVAASNSYMMKHTDFSALTQKYDPHTGTNETTGTISFYTDATLVDHINGVAPTTTVDGWDLNTPHYFIGGAID